ncbi:Uncharacterised protein r2_g1656 [Pycnogonum litorale]
MMLNFLIVKQHPYRVNRIKAEHIQNEIDYMLKHDIIESSSSEWSSPCLLVPKDDGSYRFLTDYRRLNSKTKVNAFPIPRIDDCIDNVGSKAFISKFDLLKGYWQMPLTEIAKDLSSFVVPKELYRYKVMPFGMRNYSSTFQRLMNRVIERLGRMYCVHRLFCRLIHGMIILCL